MKRVAAPLVRHILDHYRQGLLSARDAAQELRLYSDCLRAAAQKKADTWQPGLSGGDHRASWPLEVTELLRKLLSSKPSSSYSAAASEVLRRCRFKTDRASIRRWAIENKLAPDTAKPVRRWQAQDWAALWQYDASPHHWLTLQFAQLPIRKNSQ